MRTQTGFGARSIPKTSAYLDNFTCLWQQTDFEKAKKNTSSLKDERLLLCWISKKIGGHLEKIVGAAVWDIQAIHGWSYFATVHY